MGEANEGFFSSIFSIKIDLDAKIPDRYVVTVSQSGLGLPDRDFYFLSAFAEKKNAYRAYMVRLLRMLDWERPKRRRATSSISKRASQQRAGPSPKSAMRSALTLPRRSTSSRPRPLSRGGARSARRGSAKSSAWS